MTKQNVEIVVFNDKSWVRFVDYQKLQEATELYSKGYIELCRLKDMRIEDFEQENEQLKLEKCELLGIIQKKDELIKKMKQHIGCKGCKHYGKERDCRGCEKCCNGTSCNLELAK